MRILGIVLMHLFMIVNLSGQDLTAHLYFEDSNGLRDTLTFGDVEGGSSNINANLGEIDIKDEPLDDFDVRFFMTEGFTPNHPRYIYGDCDHQDFDIFICDPTIVGDYIYEAKVGIDDLPSCFTNQITSNYLEFFIPKNAAFPITIEWDSTLFQDSCRSRTNISEVPITEQDFPGTDFDWCNDRINYPYISLKDSSKVVLEQSNFLTLLRKDSTLVSTYYLTLPSSNYNGISSAKHKFAQPVEISPNPVSNQLTVDLDSEFRYEIQNIHGAKIANGISSKSLDVGSLSPGIYFLQISQKDNTYQSKKFIKL